MTEHVSDARGPLRALVRRIASGVGRRYAEARLQHELRALLRELDTQPFRDIAARYRHDSPPPGHSKYLDAAPWLEAKLRFAVALGLRGGRRLRILDIGTGAGYFPLACRYLGHEVLTTDLDSVPMYNELVACLGLPRRILRIDAFQPLPDLGARFDLITAFMICFNGHNDPGLWGPSEWASFLGDLLLRHLAPGGRVCLSLNAEARTGRPYDDALLAFFLGLGARVNGPDVLVEESGLRRGLAAIAPAADRS